MNVTGTGLAPLGRFLLELPILDVLEKTNLTAALVRHLWYAGPLLKFGLTWGFDPLVFVMIGRKSLPAGDYLTFQCIKTTTLVMSLLDASIHSDLNMFRQILSINGWKEQTVLSSNSIETTLPLVIKEMGQNAKDYNLVLKPVAGYRTREELAQDHRDELARLTLMLSEAQARNEALTQQFQDKSLSTETAGTQTENESPPPIGASNVETKTDYNDDICTSESCRKELEYLTFFVQNLEDELREYRNNEEEDLQVNELCENDKTVPSNLLTRDTESPIILEPSDRSKSTVPSVGLESGPTSRTSPLVDPQSTDMVHASGKIEGGVIGGAGSHDHADDVIVEYLSQSRPGPMQHSARFMTPAYKGFLEEIPEIAYFLPDHIANYPVEVIVKMVMKTAGEYGIPGYNAMCPMERAGVLSTYVNNYLLDEISRSGNFDKPHNIVPHVKDAKEFAEGIVNSVITKLGVPKGISEKLDGVIRFIESEKTRATSDRTSQKTYSEAASEMRVAHSVLAPVPALATLPECKASSPEVGLSPQARALAQLRGKK